MGKGGGKVGMRSHICHKGWTSHATHTIQPL